MEVKTPLEPDKYYHIYNHAVGRDNLFRSDENFNYFLQKYKYYISSVADTFAYCLMPNHFHLAVRIKSRKELIDFFSTRQGLKTLDGLELDGLELNKQISLQFGHLFNSYAQSFNKQQKRKGSLFEKNFERKHINSDEYFRSLMHYIHYNPVHHKFVEDLRDWKHSSFSSFFSAKATQLQREEVIDWFGNKENLYAHHQKQIDEKMVLELEFL